MKFICTAVLASMLFGCGWVKDDSEFVIPRSEAYYQDRGFKIVGYQGYNMFSQARCYWFTLERDKTIYESCLMKWGNEVHEYNLRALNALKAPN